MSGSGIVEFTREIAKRVFVQAIADWEMMVGFEAAVEIDDAKRVSSTEELDSLMGDVALIVRTKIEGSTPSDVFFAFPIELVASVVAKALMLPEDSRNEIVEAGIGPTEIETFQEMANLFCGSSTNALQEFYERLRVSQSVDDLKLEDPSQAMELLTQRLDEELGLIVAKLKIEASGMSTYAYWIAPFRKTMRIWSDYINEPPEHS